MIKWEHIKKDVVELNLNENHINQWTNKDLKICCF